MGHPPAVDEDLDRRPRAAHGVGGVSRSTRAPSAARLAGFYRPLASCQDRRAALPEARGLLEGIGELKDAQVIPGAAHDLDPYGQSLGVKPQGTEIAGSPVTVT